MPSNDSSYVSIKGLFLAVTLGTTVLAWPATAQSHASSGEMAKGADIRMLKTSGCGCCLKWAEHMRKAGFSVSEKNVIMGELMQTKLKAGITAKLAACHTAFVDRYVIEGHVPADQIARLLREQPDARGLAVPGMPLGSPGMDVDPAYAENYDVLLVNRDGTTSLFHQVKP